MKVLTPEQFQKCSRGTIFAYGPRWAFGSMLILDEIMVFDGSWGFYAIDPMWVDADDSKQATDRLKHMEETGASYPVETGSTKYMSYDGDSMDVFLVFEKSDWETISGMVTFPDDQPTGEKSA